MINRLYPLNRQAGSMLLEGLIAILIFSMGILAIVGMQAAAINASSNAKYRSDASLLANELIGKMWVSDRTQATLQANYSSATNGPLYQQWAWIGTDLTNPKTQAVPADGTVLASLPGAGGANLPTVDVQPVLTTITPSSLVTITVYWQAPNDTTRHSFTAIAQIGG